MIEEGTLAPDFTAHDQDDNPVTLSALRGKPVVLYFYPKANTTGCTTQALGIRDHRADYTTRGAVVLGVSPDAVKAIKRFADKYGLEFTLLADPDHAIAQAYGVWVEKSMYGRTYWGNRRTTFVISAEGTVARVLPNVKPATHDEQVLEALDALA
jgi:peroxiredoxin Q/BCP